MSKNEVIFEILEATGLNWSVAKEAIQTASGLVLPDNMAIVRQDTGQPLGIVGNRYETFQNSDLVRTVYDCGAEVFNPESGFSHPWNNAKTLGTFGNVGGGSLRNGERVFIQMELPELYVGKSNVKRYITTTNSHDGSLALGFGTTNQVICCQNTFNIANRELAKIRHTESMQFKIDEAVKSLRKVLTFENSQLEVFTEASGRSFERNHIEDIVKAVFNVNMNADAREISGRKKNQIAQLSRDINRSIDEQGETLWALFNGVTRYTNHSTGAKDKDYNLLFGNEAAINERAFNTMVSWLNMENVFA